MDAQTPKRLARDEQDSSSSKRPKLESPVSDDTIMDFGMHKDKTYSWVYKHEPGYCNWALRQPEPSGKLHAFVNYIEAKRAQPHRASPGSAASHRSAQEVYNPPAGLPFEAWKDDYVEGNIARGLKGYCWMWLETGVCFGCGFKHDYPPHWTAAQKEDHQSVLERQYLHDQYDFEVGEDEEGYDDGWFEGDQEGDEVEESDLQDDEQDESEDDEDNEDEDDEFDDYEDDEDEDDELDEDED